MSQIHVGLQMISVKDLTPNDIIGVLEEVAGLGYEGVEFARVFLERPRKRSGMPATGSASFRSAITSLSN